VIVQRRLNRLTSM